jgi:homoserine/homoserine lactone efflux protein
VTIETWALFCLTETVLCFTPGPAVLLVISLSLARGAQAGLGAAFGILTANTAYFVASATSLGAILVAWWNLFFVIKWVGAAYLIWLGLRMLFTARPTGRPGPLPSGFRPRAFVHGFVTQAANPKALVFFTALLPQFIDPRRGVPRQVMILGVSGVLIELVVLALYVAACHGARRWVGDSRFVTPLQRIGGVFLVGAGARLAVIRHA